MDSSSPPMASVVSARRYANPSWHLNVSGIDGFAIAAYNSTASINWSSLIMEDFMEDDGTTGDPLSGFPYPSLYSWTHVINPSLYSWTHIIGASVAVTVVMLSIIFGNGLVVVAIVVDRGLRGLQNWFVASLAISDLLVGLFIMPLTLTNELVGYWPFGNAICELWLSTDVLLCTASILNLCLISLDRYWSIVQPIAYVRWRTPRRSAAMISVVWILSMVICLPPLVGWKRPQPTKYGRYPLCVLSEEPGYIIYSSMGSFYLPLVVMVLVYFKIYLAARDRARRNLKTKSKTTRPLSTAVACPSSPAHVVPNATRSTTVTTEAGLEASGSKHNFDERERSALISQQAAILEPDSLIESDEDVNVLDIVEQHASGKLDYDALNQCADDIDQPLPDDATYCSTVVLCSRNPHSNAVALACPTDPGSPCSHGIVSVQHQPMIEHQLVAAEVENESSSEVVDRQENGFVERLEELEALEESNSRMALLNSPPVDTSIKSDRRKARDCCRNHRSRFDEAKQRRSLAVANSCPTPNDCAPVRRSSSLLPVMKNYFRSASTDRGGSHSNKRHRSVDLVAMSLPDPERMKRKLARARERRATLVLGIVMASFIGCWLPFFAIYPATALSGIEVSPSLFAVIFWLGYCNSALNPIIYTIFNRDFRVAFVRILFCGEWRRKYGGNGGDLLRR